MSIVFAYVVHAVLSEEEILRNIKSLAETSRAGSIAEINENGVCMSRQHKVSMSSTFLTTSLIWLQEHICIHKLNMS